MKRLGPGIALTAVVAFSAAACGAAASTGSAPRALRVAPAHGHPLTAFVVRFTAPQPSGTFGTEVRRYQLTAAPAQARHGCIGSVSAMPRATRAGETVTVRLDPRRLGGRWCAETYRGRVVETQSAACGPPAQQVCPQYLVLVKRIGTFRLRVTR